MLVRFSEPKRIILSKTEKVHSMETTKILSTKSLDFSRMGINMDLVVNFDIMA